ncbi:hypothetical protein G4B88_005683 [Cannabis sativa]|uniref:Large ribosomal subunit protein eL14 domain-containing protein n=1 Tax=Cannabis sativa TaxID=3483 RepID=A0A7J6EJN2_CANSA|nr:hypothetical protein G4B88_005683 [Cannabis sativa]
MEEGFRQWGNGVSHKMGRRTSRVALVNYGKDYGQLVVNVIIDIIDQNQPVIERVCEEAIMDSPHMVRGFASLISRLTSKRVPKKKEHLAAIEVAGRCNSSWGRKLIIQKRRAALNDFDRIKLMLAKIKKV